MQLLEKTNPLFQSRIAMFAEPRNKEMFLLLMEKDTLSQFLTNPIMSSVQKTQKQKENPTSMFLLRKPWQRI